MCLVCVHSVCLYVITCATFSGSVLYSVCMWVYTSACVSQYNMILNVIRVCVCIPLHFLLYQVHSSTDGGPDILCHLQGDISGHSETLGSHRGGRARQRQTETDQGTGGLEGGVCVVCGVSIMKNHVHISIICVNIMHAEVYRAPSPNIISLTRVHVK